MAILNNPIQKTLTTVSGDASDTFQTHGTCQQILVKPTTSTTQYDFSVINASSLAVFEHIEEVGTMNELLTLPLSGIFTVQIENATLDEAFTVLIVIRNS